MATYLSPNFHIKAHNANILQSNQQRKALWNNADKSEMWTNATKSKTSSLRTWDKFTTAVKV